MSTREWVAIAASISVALVLLIFGDQWIESFFKEKENISAPTPYAAEITGIEGLVQRKASHQTQFNSLAADSTIHHLDQIKIERGASALLRFKSGYQLQLHPQSRVTVELWDPDNPASPLFVNFLEGQFTMTAKGKVGELYIVQDGQVFVPSQKPPQIPPVVIFDKNLLPKEPAVQDEDGDDDDDESTENSTEAEESALRGIPKTPPTPILSKDGTLTSEYLKEHLYAQAEHFRKCQTNSLHNQQSATGDILVTMTVAPSGQVENLRVVQTSIKDPQLQSCALSVLERMRFHAFSGPDVMVNYPLKFR